jgi:glutamyl-tRNA synthetase
MKETLAAHQVKMPQLAPAVRVLVCGRRRRPASTPCWRCLTRSTVLARLQAF